MELLVTYNCGVCEIKFNRPEVFNSFNKSMALALQKALDECEKNDEVRAIVITGEGKAFCAGQDLAEATEPNGPELKTIVRDHYNPIIERIRNIEKPIIAAVNGVAAGAGGGCSTRAAVRHWRRRENAHDVRRQQNSSYVHGCAGEHGGCGAGAAVGRSNGAAQGDM